MGDISDSNHNIPPLIPVTLNSRLHRAEEPLDLLHGKDTQCILFQCEFEIVSRAPVGMSSRRQLYTEYSTVRYTESEESCGSAEDP